MKRTASASKSKADGGRQTTPDLDHERAGPGPWKRFGNTIPMCDMLMAQTALTHVIVVPERKPPAESAVAQEPGCGRRRKGPKRA